MVLQPESIIVNPNPNPNLNLNTQNDPLNQILANMAPVHVPLPIHAPDAAQAAQNLAQQVPALAAVVPPAQLPAQAADQNTPPAQAQLLQPPGAPRRAPRRLNQFQPMQFGPGRNLLLQFNMLQEQAEPRTPESNLSSQVHFTPPSVCKPGLKRQFRDSDSDGSPSAGRWQGLRN